jgi:hypothetical protein
MTLFKCHANSIISTPGARCIMIDIKDFYLNTPIKRPEYMRLKITDIPDEIIEQYNLRELVVDNGYVLRNHKRHVPLTAGMDHSTKPIGNTTGKAWISSIKNHTRPLDACNKTNHLHAGSRRLHNKDYE